MTITAAVTTANWNTNGAWVGSVQPTAADDVVIPSGAHITIPSATTVLGRSVNVQNGGELIFAATTSQMTVGDASGGAVTFGATSTLTLTAIGTINFVATTGTTLSLTTAGRTMPNLTVNCGSTTTIQFADAVTATGATLTLTAGKWDWNGKTVVAGAFNYGNATARTITFGGAPVTLTLAAGWTGTAITNLTVTANSATVTMNGASATFAGGAQNWNGLTVAMTGSGTATTSGAFTVAGFTRTGTAATTDIFTPSAFTFTGTLTLGGNTTQGINRLLAQSISVGTSVTITGTGAAVVISGDVDFLDITISGSPSWTNAGSAFVGDALGNGSLITTNRTTPATQTATGTASFAWSTHGWTSRVPLPQDNVSIPNAFVAGRTVTADMPRLGADVSFAGATGSPILSVSVQVNLYGSITLATGVAPSGTNSINLNGRSSHTITSAGATFTQALTVNAPGGTYTLADNLTISRNASNAIFFPQGTLVDAGVTVTLSGASATFSPSGTLTMTGTWNFGTTGAVTFWAPSGTVTATGSTIALTAASANTRIFAGGGKTYGTLTYTVAGSTGILRITGANTFAAINFSDATNARTLTLPSSTTTTISTAAGFNVNGTAANLVTLNSSTSGTTGTLSVASGTVIGQYLSLKDSTATGGATFYAQLSSASTNVVGWVSTGVTGVATGTGSAGNGTASIATAANVATGAGSAGSPTVSITAFGGNAAGSGTANSAVVTLAIVAQLATGTGNAGDAFSSITSAADSASGTGSAFDGHVGDSQPVVSDDGGGGGGVPPAWRLRPPGRTPVKHAGTVYGTTAIVGWCKGFPVGISGIEGINSVRFVVHGLPTFSLVGRSDSMAVLSGYLIVSGSIAGVEAGTGLGRGTPLRGDGVIAATTQSKHITAIGVASRSGFIPNNATTVQRMTVRDDVERDAEALVA